MELADVANEDPCLSLAIPLASSWLYGKHCILEAGRPGDSFGYVTPVLGFVTMMLKANLTAYIGRNIGNGFCLETNCPGAAEKGRDIPMVAAKFGLLVDELLLFGCYDF